MLLIFGGLPAVGKTAIATGLAQGINAVHLRIDSIEQSLRNSNVTISGPEGYVVAYVIAEDNLRLGRTVIADSVNPVEVTRAAWRRVSQRAGKRCIEIEISVPTRRSTGAGSSHEKLTSSATDHRRGSRCVIESMNPGMPISSSTQRDTRSRRACQRCGKDWKALSQPSRQAGMRGSESVRRDGSAEAERLAPGTRTDSAQSEVWIPPAHRLWIRVSVTTGKFGQRAAHDSRPALRCWRARAGSQPRGCARSPRRAATPGQPRR